VSAVLQNIAHIIWSHKWFENCTRSDLRGSKNQKVFWNTGYILQGTSLPSADHPL